MKKIILLALAILIATPLVSAQTEIQNTLSPNNKLWYVLDRLPEKISLFWSEKITRNGVRVFEKKLMNIAEREEEARQLILLNRNSLAIKSLDVLKEDLDSIPSDITSIPEGLQNNIKFGLDKSLERLRELRERLPEEKRNILDNSISVHEQTIQRTNEKIKQIFNEKYGDIIISLDSGSRRNIDDEEE